MLQKLVYYSQAWHLVWEERRLFEEPIEAWVNGPVVRELYRRHRGLWQVDASTSLGGNPDALDTDQKRRSMSCWSTTGTSQRTGSASAAGFDHGLLEHRQMRGQQRLNPVRVMAMG